MIYFISDTHLGLNYGKLTDIEREKHLCSFLDSIKGDCEELFLLGDIFDFWFEWNRTVPQGFVRTLAKLADFTDSGIKVHFFTGNHDLWIENYLSDHIGLTLHRGTATIERQSKRLFLSHGDTQYKNRGFSKFLEVLFRSHTAKWLGQRLIHPDLMVRFGQGWSSSNRRNRGEVAHNFTGESDNWVRVSREILTTDPDIDYFVYGHLHCPIIYNLSDSKQMIVLGEWVENPTYGTLSDGEFKLHSFPFNPKNIE